jgi:hypothetical protein
VKTLAVIATIAAIAAAAGAAREDEPSVDLDARRAAIAQRLAQQPESRAVATATRAAVVLDTSAGPVVLWVAPTSGGGRCSVVDIAALPVESPTCTRSSGLRPWESETRVGDASLRLLGARVPPATTKTVEVRFADGKLERLRPSRGFVLRELNGDERPVLVTARDGLGRAVSRPMPGPRTFRRELPFPTDDFRTVIELERSELAVAPGTNGTVCTRTAYRGAQRWSCGARPARLALDLRRDGRLVAGAVGGGIRQLQVWFANGEAVRAALVEGYVLLELPRGRIPRLLVGLDASGAIVARQRL